MNKFSLGYNTAIEDVVATLDILARVDMSRPPREILLIIKEEISKLKKGKEDE